MGNSGTSSYKSKTIVGLEKFDCSPYIHTSDIRKYIQKNDYYISAHFKKLLQEAIYLLAIEDDWIFYDCEIRIVGIDRDVIFYSGSPKNVYVICEREGEVERVCKSRSLRHMARDGGRSVWGWVQQQAGTLFGIGAGVAKLALTFF